MPGQDSYSYELAHIFTGADDETALRAKYERCVEELAFEAEAGRQGGSAGVGGHRGGGKRQAQPT